MSKQDQGFFNEQWIMFMTGPFFHFPFFIGIALPILMGVSSRNSRFAPSPSYILGWICNIAAAWFYYHGWFS